MGLKSLFAVFMVLMPTFTKTGAFDSTNQLAGIRSFKVPNEPSGYSYDEAIHGYQPFPLENYPRDPCMKVEFVGKEENIPVGVNQMIPPPPLPLNPVFHFRQRKVLSIIEDEDLDANEDEDTGLNKMDVQEEIESIHPDKSYRKIRSLQDEDNEEASKYFKRFGSIIRQSYVPVIPRTYEGKVNKEKEHKNSYNNISVGHNSSTNIIDELLRNEDVSSNIIYPVLEQHTSHHEESTSVFCSFDTKYCVGQEMTSCFRMINGLLGDTCINDSKKFLRDIVKLQGLKSMSLQESIKKCFSDIASKCSKLSFSCTIGNAADILKNKESASSNSVFCKSVNPN